jgi:murein DD-endopeptidase MepM/ murein hydrolase activator NlpD
MALRIGCHAGTKGFTAACKAVMDILPDVCLWLADTHQPHDATTYPTSTHILRLRNPQPGEGYVAYANRMERECNLRSWYDAPIPRGALIWVVGNEPEQRGYDLDVPWTIADWLANHAGYLSEVKARYPGIGFLATPFTSMDTDQATTAYVAPYEGIACHAYWAKGNTGWRQKTNGGATWSVFALTGKPIYVTEVNSNPADADEILAWAGEVSSDLVKGACLYIAESDSDPQYVVTPQMATAVRDGLVPSPPAPNPPPPQPEPVTTYTRDYDPRGYRPLDSRWQPFIAGHNLAEANAIVAAYDASAKAIDYDANAMIAQGAVETAVFTSPRWHSAHNAAGIGIYADSTPDVQFGTIERGIEGQAELLADYFGDGRKPWGILASFNPPLGFGYGLGKTKLSDMDGVWAADKGYSAAIVGYLNQVMVGGSPAPPPPVEHYPLVYPVDDAIIQGSDGSFSHGGKVPGFYAIDFASKIGTPIRACGDGVVTAIYWQDSNPISLRTGHSTWIDHDCGYSTFSCHQTDRTVAVGDRVVQGQIIGTTGDPASQPNNGYGDGPHLHWEVWDTASHVRVRMEDLAAAQVIGPWNGTVITDKWETAPMVGDGFSDDEILRLWYGTNKPTAAAKKSYPYNHDFGIETAYRDLANGNFKTVDQDLMGKSIVLGQCISKEEADTGTPGRSVRYFSEGKITALKQPDGSYLMRVN